MLQIYAQPLTNPATNKSYKSTKRHIHKRAEAIRFLHIQNAYTKTKPVSQLHDSHTPAPIFARVKFKTRIHSTAQTPKKYNIAYLWPLFQAQENQITTGLSFSEPGRPLLRVQMPMH